MPSAPARRAPILLAALVVVAAVGIAAYVAGRRAGAVREAMWANPAEAQRIAFVKEWPCAGGACQSLWIGTTRDDAREVATLEGGRERCEEIAWAKDGLRVGFLINGYQLRVFDGESGEQVGQTDLVPGTGIPTSRIARGVTFSQNGAAVTFDDCPRYSSGCRSGLAAVR